MRRVGITSEQLQAWTERYDELLAVGKMRVTLGTYLQEQYSKELLWRRPKRKAVSKTPSEQQEVRA